MQEIDVSSTEEMTIEPLIKRAEMEFELEDALQVDLGYEIRFIDCNSTDQWLAVSG